MEKYAKLLSIRSELIALATNCHGGSMICLIYMHENREGKLNVVEHLEKLKPLVIKYFSHQSHGSFNDLSHSPVSQQVLYSLYV
jgi:hypothetical protein